MVSDKTNPHSISETAQAISFILHYKIDTTNDLLTSNTGLASIAHLMQSIDLTNTINNALPAPKSNRAFAHADYFNTLILMMHEGSFQLDHVKNIADDKALCTLLKLENIPKPSSLGGWLRRMEETQLLDFWHDINRSVRVTTLHNCKEVTLDIDATEIIANKRSAEWTYKKNKGFMLIVDHIAEYGQIVSCEFRQGNTSPAKNNLEFIQQCQQALPKGCSVKAVRIDAAGYQEAIILHCDENNMRYAIRAIKQTERNLSLYNNYHAPSSVYQCPTGNQPGRLFVRIQIRSGFTFSIYRLFRMQCISCI